MVCKSLNKNINDVMQGLIIAAKLMDYEIELYHLNEDYSGSRGPIHYYFEKDDYACEFIFGLNYGKIEYIETLNGLLSEPGKENHKKVKSPTESEVLESITLLSQAL